jgi:hypothetical protein
MATHRQLQESAARRAQEDTSAGAEARRGAFGRRAYSSSVRRVKHPRCSWLAALLLLAGCERGPQLCIFDGTSIGATPMPMVALNPDGTLAPESRYSWQEFTWPTDPALGTVEHVGSSWVFRGTTGGQPWTFTGAFSGTGGAFARTGDSGGAPLVAVDGMGGRPVLLRYRVKPCREFLGSKTGVRTCVDWGRELNARTKLHCD